MAHTYDCIIIGAGPGGLQAAIYLGRCNYDVLLLDRGGGRTHHARHIENFLGHEKISGKELLERGIAQARRFNVQFDHKTVLEVRKEQDAFIVSCKDASYRSRFVIAASGVYDIFPPIENVHVFLGAGYYTCIDCDGYRTMNKKLVVIGDSLHACGLARAMKKMYTEQVSFIPYGFTLPDSFAEILREEKVSVITHKPISLFGTDVLHGIECEGGHRVECEAILSHFGFRLNDGFLANLGLEKDRVGFKYVTNSSYESSMPGLYIIGPLNTGHDQAVIAAGEGAVAALDIKRQLLG